MNVKFKTARRCPAWLMRTVLALALLHILPSGIGAQQLFKTLDARDGLTSSQINCILKDASGYMWFGTPAGLYRYDGYQFKHFQSDSQDGTSLPDSYIESIQEGVDGDLWIKTASGYCIYHTQTESFDRDMRLALSRIGIDKMPTIIFIDSKKFLWGYIPSEGIISYNMQQQLKHEFGYSNSDFAIPQGDICSIGECKDGAVIVYSDGRLVCCNAMRQQTSPWRNSDIANRGLRHTNTLKVYADPQDKIWLYGQGTLFVYNKASNTWDTTIGDQLGLTGIGVDNAVNAIAGGHNGKLIMATNRHGLMSIDMSNNQMEPVIIRARRNADRLASTTNVQSIYVDDSDMLWVGTSKSGVAYYGGNIYKFTSELIGDITAMAQDTAGVVRYGTSDNGIVGYEGQLASLKVSAMQYTRDGSLWVGSQQNGLTRIKPDGSVHIYSEDDGERNTLINDHVKALCCDNTGNLWIATDGGMQMFNLRMEQFSNFTKENKKLRTNNITSIFYASNNRMLMGTAEGLAVMNVATFDTKFYTGNSTSMQKFTNNYITQVFEDSRGLIWIGTREGVNILNMDRDNLDILTERMGLCNNNICGIAEDNNHNIWLSTTNGVCRIVVQHNHDGGNYDYGLYNYSITDGLQSDEFNVGAIMTKSDGNVLMGGLYGISTVRQRSDDESSSRPVIILTQLLLGEEEVQVGVPYNGNIVLQKVLNATNRIVLNSDQNTFTIKFAAGNYNMSERLQFTYSMDGLDNEWHNGDPISHGVTFTDLSPGRYLLHVQAISPDGGNSNQEHTLEIIISKPWFLQWWMLALYAVIAIIIIYLWKKGIDQLRELWKRKNQVITELAQQREDIKAASDELRQPMSRMTSIIMNLAEREDGSMEEREQLNTLHSQMLQIITRVSDMQTALEHPEEKAKKLVNRQYELNSKGEMDMPELLTDELSSEIKPHNDLPTAKFHVVFVDDNTDFLKFVAARLKHVYDFHAYNDVHKAASDIETSIPDLVICKQDLEDMTGSELCNNIKMHPKLSRIKFVLMTEKKLNPRDMVNQGITLSADDYLAKPFNVQEAVMRFNKLLGIGPIDLSAELIEGAETRLLEDRNSSMTTATESLPSGSLQLTDVITEDEQLQELKVTAIRRSDTELATTGEREADEQENNEFFEQNGLSGNYSMADAIDQQLINSIEQYVQQNMSRGPISLEEMARSMGMSMKPFFQKVRDITGKTPAEVVRDIRLKHGCILLQRTNINMSELANNIGFATSDHFINMFKDRFGITPSEYRLKYRK
ncbi:MAG: helix-turn-helix domain-containing protein [Prevotella sp.]|nr:helix-turn-helix domain-containing protein [Prevotella sp.]